MLRHPFFLLIVCLGLFFTAYDASAKSRQSDTAEYSTKSTKVAKSKSAGVSPKEAVKASNKSRAAGSAKKTSKKQEVQVSTKAKLAKTKDLTSRKQKISRRDPASLPDIDENFAETPDSVLTALSAIPADGNLSSPFGMRRLSSKTKRVRMHTGIDIAAERGAPVFAAADGKVCFVGRWAAYGRIVEIDHGNGLVTRYAHLDRYIVKEGDMMAAGEQIGNIGRSGRTTGAHLHFETLVNGKAVNPMMAELLRQTPAQLATKRGMYVSELSASGRAY